MSAETFERHGKPFRFHHGVPQRVGCAPILADYLADDSVGVRVAGPRIAGIHDEAEISQALFDSAQTPLTARIKIDFTCAGCDSGIFQMSFESHDRSSLRSELAAVPGDHARERPRSTSRVDRKRCGNRLLGLVGSQSYSCDHFLFRD